MFGITIDDFLRLTVQLGLAVAGAASLWGLVLTRKAVTHPEERESFYKLAKLIGRLFFVGILVFLIAWWAMNIFILAPTVGAHEGIRLDPSLNELRNGFAAAKYLVLAIMAALLAYFVLKVSKKWTFEKHASTFFGINFALISLVGFFMVFTGKFDGTQISFFLHSWHSILTLGTVIVVDFFYTMVRDISLKRTLYNFFPIMSAAIWTGLGLDFISVIFVYGDAISLTQQFYFVQTVVAIIIINGSLLSGKINDLLINSVKPGAEALSKSILILMGLSGSISIISWLSITFVDFFQLTLGFWQLVPIYLAGIVAAYFARGIIEGALDKSAKTETVAIS